MLSSHSEGVGNEIIYSWNPSWIKNGERRTFEALQGKQFKIHELKRAIDRVKVIPMRSFVQNYYLLLQALWNTGTANTVTDTGGTGRSYPSSFSSTGINAMDMGAGAGTSTYGIVVGSNSTAVTRADTKLNTQVVAGATSTTLTHGTTSIGAVTNVSTNISQVSVTRTLTGNAGSTVTLAEDGVYINFSTSNFKICIERNISNFGAVIAAQNVTITKNFAITT